jgi:hypothetical protein
MAEESSNSKSTLVIGALTAGVVAAVGAIGYYTYAR